jgi:hypothetical protein
MADGGNFPGREKRMSSSFNIEQPMSLRAQSGTLQVNAASNSGFLSIRHDLLAQGWLYKRAPRSTDKDKDKTTMRMISSFGKSVKGVFNKNAHYQRRWCAIEDETLSYYKSNVCTFHESVQETLKIAVAKPCTFYDHFSQTDISGAPLGSVDLSIVQEAKENTEAKNPPGLAFDLVCTAPCSRCAASST